MQGKEGEKQKAFLIVLFFYHGGKIFPEASADFIPYLTERQTKIKGLGLWDHTQALPLTTGVNLGKICVSTSQHP